ncbi:hypothetical protein CPLU01_14893 [Colletotrichum plurivorum]|uniref:Uncharacterized protein n=1 Tax=Colletotrichum plurivorum TaxID=2175906 RepID=A0A8H6JFV5_9PEZI|nr:hypothetical protein CPLU01_14893 [Colletotrichum plurivorum]
MVKLITLPALTTLLLASKAIATWDDCTQVSYETLLSVKTDAHPTLGPDGLYATTSDGQCVYVDASAGSAFSLDYPKEHAVVVSVAQEADVSGIDFLASFDPLGIKVRPGKPHGSRSLGERATCGQVCSSSLSGPNRCTSCSCKYDTTVCAGQPPCIAYYRCK